MSACLKMKGRKTQMTAQHRQPQYKYWYITLNNKNIHNGDMLCDGNEFSYQ